MNLNIFAAREVDIYSQTELIQIWNLVFFAKYSGNTLKLPNKSKSWEFMSKQESSHGDTTYDHNN